ncbi:MAG: cupredoxin domain-containing protein [Candidatus Entotheonellia bacterium]
MKGQRVFVLVLLGMLCVTACSRDDTPQKPASTETPAITRQASQPTAQAPRIIELTLTFIAPHFRPDPLVLQVGQPVQFKISSADTRHFLVIEAFGIELEIPQKSLNEAATSKVVTPQEVGTFRMLCRIHARLPMEGTIEVRDTGAASN